MSAELPDPLRQHSDAKRDFDAGKAGVDQLAQYLRETAESLTRDPAGVTTEGPGRRLNTNRQVFKAINSSEWPTFESVEDVVSRFHAALQALAKVEGNLSPEDRKTLGLPIVR